MRFAVMGTFFLGLLIAVDQTYLGYSRCLNKYERYMHLRKPETEAIQAQAKRELTKEENNAIMEAGGALSQIHRHIDDWQLGSCLALGFLGCVLVWLAMITATHRTTGPGSLLRRSLKGSIIGANVVGTCLTCAFGFAFLLTEPDSHRHYDRFEWEVRWLIGGIGGAGVGALFGSLAGPMANLFRRSQKSGTAMW